MSHWLLLRAELTSSPTNTCSLPPAAACQEPRSSPAGPLAQGPSWARRPPVSWGRVHLGAQPRGTHPRSLRGCRWLQCLAAVGPRPPECRATCLLVKQLTALPLAGRNGQAAVPRRDLPRAHPLYQVPRSHYSPTWEGGAGGGRLSAAWLTWSGSTHRRGGP